MVKIQICHARRSPCGRCQADYSSSSCNPRLQPIRMMRLSLSVETLKYKSGHLQYAMTSANLIFLQHGAHSQSRQLKHMTELIWTSALSSKPASYFRAQQPLIQVSFKYSQHVRLQSAVPRWTWRSHSSVLKVQFLVEPEDPTPLY